jgi:aminopeptidase N
MSTYLVALVVSDFTCKSGFAHPVLSQNVSVSICGRTTAYDQLDYALDQAIKSIEALENYYQIAYPLGKAGEHNLII